MPSLLDNAGGLLDDFSMMKDDPEASQDAVEVNPEIATKLRQFSERTRGELARMFSPNLFHLIQLTNC